MLCSEFKAFVIELFLTGLEETEELEYELVSKNALIKIWEAEEEQKKIIMNHIMLFKFDFRFSEYYITFIFIKSLLIQKVKFVFLNLIQIV